MNFVDFFSNLGFDFNVDLKPKAIDIEKEATLSRKLKDSVFFYKSPNNTNTSFYLLTSSLEQKELEHFRKYVWNKNDADIIFYYHNQADEVRMLYAKYSPKVTNKECTLEVFSTNQKDLNTLENINRWQFESGAFWLKYSEFVTKGKYKGIDKELVFVLDALKMKLAELLSKIISDEEERKTTVQALIDRTLYIKYLEDRHIINSYFYNRYFEDPNLSYQKLLQNKNKKGINKLFIEIHKIFNNVLFDTPKINELFLTDEICDAIARSFNHNIMSSQLRLFDFRFDVLPVEFISYIYEVFLSEQQKANGIYYTPKKLAQLIVDDVIPEDAEIGSILDPSCGSGMFLIVGFQRLLEIAKKKRIEPEKNIDKIRFRLQLLSENIFGIEKQITAQRFTLFSLSLQIFDGIDADEIKRFISNELEKNNRITLFNEFCFHENIIHQNTLDIEKKAFESKKFKYILGNPPFIRKEVSEDAKYFTNNYEISVSNKKLVAKNIIDGYQISQCFLLKIKEWSDENTRLGFISNSSNFYNEAQKFQKFFYSNYGIEKIYELSRVKKILFEKANESVVAIIFTNNFEDNVIDYYPVDLGLFSDKPFELLIIQEDKVIKIVQSELIHKDIRLRDFLVGNEYDNLLVNRLSNSNSLQEYILKDDDFFLHRGIQVVGFEEIEREFGISKENWKSLPKNQRNDYYEAFKNLYSSQQQTKDFSIPFIKPSNIEKFKINSYNSFLGNDISMFHRPRNKELYQGERIVWSRIGKSLKAVYFDKYIYFDFDIYVLKLANENYYHLMVAILNSDLINYFSNIHLKKRIDSSFPKIGMDDIKNIPIPLELDNELVTKVSDLSKHLCEGKFEYSEKETQLNEIIFDLYELSYWEKQRVKDYFLPKSRIGRKKKALDEYKNALKEIVGFYFESLVAIEETNTDFNLIVVKISFSNSYVNPQVAKTKKYLLNEIFEQNPKANFLVSQEKIFGKDCVYIIKEDVNKNWTETKAFEDGQDIIKNLMPKIHGERVHQK